MKIKQISDHAWQLTRYGLCNAFLVRETDGYTLIDTTIAGAAEDILAAARRVGPAVNPEICRILLTHAHADHIGSLDQVVHLLGNAEVAISQRDARLLPPKPQQDRSLDPGEAQCPVKGSFSGAKAQVSHFVTEGELYGSLRCFATPGHTPGHFSFLDERDGTLYVGDALVTMGGSPRIAGWAPWFFPLPNFGTWHRPTARGSVERLLTTIPADTPIRRIAPGHGNTLEGGNELLQQALVDAKL